MDFTMCRSFTYYTFYLEVLQVYIAYRLRSVALTKGYNDNFFHRSSGSSKVNINTNKQFMYLMNKKTMQALNNHEIDR